MADQRSQRSFSYYERRVTSRIHRKRTRSDGRDTEPIQTAHRSLSNPTIFVNGKMFRDTPPKKQQSGTERFVPILGRLMDRQINYQTRLSRLTDQSDLEGWEFDDIVTRRTEIRSKAVKIKRPAKSWVRLCKDINALVLFGSGFGEIIQPLENNKASLERKMSSSLNTTETSSLNKFS